MLQAVLYVVKELACQQAVLLPVVSQVFLRAYEPTHSDESSNTVYLNVAEDTITLFFTVATESAHCAHTIEKEL